MLVELSSLVGVKVDETARAMVSFVAVNEPVTMYRVARGLNMHFSHVYRKVNKLVAQRLLEPASAGRSTVYYATVRGLLIPLIYGTAPKSLILAKIKRRLRLETFSDEEVEAFLKFYGRVAAGDAPLEGLELVGAYLATRCGNRLENCFSQMERGDAVLASRVAAYAVISLVRKIFDEALIVRDEEYTAVLFREDGGYKLFAAHCKMCGRDKYCSLDPCPTLMEKILGRIRLRPRQA